MSPSKPAKLSDMNLPKPKAVIFDWDNTLVNTWPVIHDALNATFRDMGKPEWTMAETKNRVAKSMRDSFPVVFGEDWQKASELYQAHYRATHLGKLQALPRAEEVLKKVKELSLYSVVVSNKRGNNLRTEIAHIGWKHYFSAVVGADDAVRDKPHSDPVHMAFDKSGIIPGSDVWFLGDSEVDLECALETGCTAILYGPSAKEHPEYTKTHFRGFPYHAHMHDHTETLELLSSL